MRVFILASVATTAIAASNGAAKPAAKADTPDNNAAPDGSPFAIMLAAQQLQSNAAPTQASHASQASPASPHGENTLGDKSGANSDALAPDKDSSQAKPAAKDDAAANDNPGANPQDANALSSNPQLSLAAQQPPQPDAAMMPALQAQLAAQLPAQIAAAPQPLAANDDGDDLSISGIPQAGSPTAACAQAPSPAEASAASQAGVPSQAPAQTSASPQAGNASQPDPSPQIPADGATSTDASNGSQTASAVPASTPDSASGQVQDFVSQLAAFAGPAQLAAAPKSNSPSNSSPPNSSATSSADSSRNSAAGSTSPAVSSTPPASPPLQTVVNNMAASSAPGKNSPPAAGKDASSDKSSGQDANNLDSSAGKAAQQTASAAPQPQQQQPAPAAQPAQNQPLAVTVAAPAQPGAPLQPGANNVVAASVHLTAQTATPDLGSLAVAIAARSQSGARQFDIRLDPPELGRVEVRLSIDAGGRTEAHMSADQPETLSLLQKDSTSLTQALRDAGLNVSDNGLNFSLRGQGGQQGQAGNGQQGQSRANFTATPVIEAAQSASSNSFQSGDGRLDISV